MKCMHVYVRVCMSVALHAEVRGVCWEPSSKTLDLIYLDRSRDPPVSAH